MWLKRTIRIVHEQNRPTCRQEETRWWVQDRKTKTRMVALTIITVVSVALIWDLIIWVQVVLVTKRLVILAIYLLEAILASRKTPRIKVSVISTVTFSIGKRLDRSFYASERLKTDRSTLKHGYQKLLLLLPRQTRFWKDDRSAPTNDLIAANLPLSWSPRARVEIQWLDLERQYELLSASGLPGLLFASALLSRAQQWPLPFYLSRSTGYKQLLCFGKRKRGVSSRRVAPVARCDTVQTFSLSRG